MSDDSHNPSDPGLPAPGSLPDLMLRQMEQIADQSPALATDRACVLIGAIANGANLGTTRTLVWARDAVDGSGGRIVYMCYAITIPKPADGGNTPELLVH